MKLPKGMRQALAVSASDQGINPALMQQQFKARWAQAQAQEEELHKARFTVAEHGVRVTVDGQPRIIDLELEDDADIEVLCIVINRALKQAGIARSQMATELIQSK